MDYDFATPDGIIAEVMTAFRPPPDITVSEWSDKYRRLSAESSASPGRFRTEMVEYMREPMDMVGQPGVRRITLMTSAQVGKSTVIENVIGYFIHQDPCPILHVSPTLDSMKMFSKERLAPMIRDTPALRGIVKDARARDSGNTLASKTFPGGHIAMVGSNAPAGLASRPIRVVVADEVDRFDSSAGTEGDPINLAVKRTTTFWNRVIIFVSTPGNKATSRIEPEFLRSDQRYRWCPCPQCGEYQRLAWAQVHWEEGQPDTAHYVCEHNGCIWDDQDRNRAVRAGEWRAEKPFNGNVGYHLSQLYSPFAPLADGVRDFLDSKDNPQLLKTWVNTFLGETWEERGRRLEWSDLMDHREDYDTRDNIPEDITLVTGAVDIQDDRAEVEFVGWGDDHQSWSLGYQKVYGDPSTPEFWQDLRDVLSETFIHPLFGEIAPRSIAIDSGGHYTTSVYKFTQVVPRTVAIKGVSGAGKPIVGRPLKNTLGNARVLPLGVDTIKELVVARLKITDPDAAGYNRFPAHYDDDYFRGMTAEELRTTYYKGFPKNEWVKIRPRNEPFDLRVYNTAALEMLQVDLNAQRREALRKASKPATQETEKPAVKAKPIVRQTASWANRWKNG
jgi:phage terminase large subunit GpA-like protein